jgi:hypothetical protein
MWFLVYRNFFNLHADEPRWRSCFSSEPDAFSMPSGASLVVSRLAAVEAQIQWKQLRT